MNHYSSAMTFPPDATIDQGRGTRAMTRDMKVGLVVAILFGGVVGGAWLYRNRQHDAWKLPDASTLASAPAASSGNVKEAESSVRIEAADSSASSANLEPSAAPGVLANAGGAAPPPAPKNLPTAPALPVATEKKPAKDTKEGVGPLAFPPPPAAAPKIAPPPPALTPPPPAVTSKKMDDQVRPASATEDAAPPPVLPMPSESGEKSPPVTPKLEPKTEVKPSTNPATPRKPAAPVPAPDDLEINTPMPTREPSSAAPTKASNTGESAVSGGPREPLPPPPRPRVPDVAPSPRHVADAPTAAPSRRAAPLGVIPAPPRYTAESATGAESVIPSRSSIAANNRTDDAAVPGVATPQLNGATDAEWRELNGSNEPREPFRRSGDGRVPDRPEWSNEPRPVARSGATPIARSGDQPMPSAPAAAPAKPTRQLADLNEPGAEPPMVIARGVPASLTEPAPGKAIGSSGGPAGGPRAIATSQPLALAPSKDETKRSEPIERAPAESDSPAFRTVGAGPGPMRAPADGKNQDFVAVDPPRVANDGGAPRNRGGLRSYDAESYITLQGDTFESVAGAMYRNASLGPELARYNRSFAASNESLPVGRRIILPPVNVLTRRTSPMADQAVASTAREASPREPAKAFRRVAPDTENVAASPVKDPPGMYTVREPITLYAIAKRTLGDGRRWREIHDLNADRLPNEFDVPVGVTLRLPPGAKP